MNNKIRTILLGGIVSASLAAPAVAGDFSSNSITSGATSAFGNVSSLLSKASGNFDFSTGYHSKYLWRGIDFGDELADWSLETSFQVADFDLTAGVWGGNVFEQQGGSEVDFYVSTTKDLGWASAEFGYILYYFNDNTSGNTQEFYLGLNKEVAGYELSATWYYDFDQNDGNYLELTAGRSYSGVDAALTLGVNPLDGDFTHIQATVSKGLKLNSAVTLTPYATYSYALTSTDDFGNNRESEFVAGASLGFSF